MGQPIRAELTIFRRNELGEKLSTYIRKQIKEAREEKGLSQRELSGIIKRSSAFISQVEAGRLDPTTLDLISLASVLDKPIGYFLPQIVKHDEDALSDKEWQLVRQFRRIPTGEIQDVAIRQVKQLAEIKPKGTK